MESIINKINKDPFSVNELSISDLESVIIYANDKYYNTSVPVFTDNIYDILIDFLKIKSPKSKILKKVGSKLKSKDKIKLEYWLGSMDKIKPDQIKDFNKWLDKYKGDYVLSDKLDGISCLLVYYINDNIKMFSRGDASEGLDLTPLIKYFKLPSIDIISKTNYKATKSNILFAVRGELILDRETFTNNWSNKNKNGRNTVGGLVNSKNIDPKLALDTRFVVYEVVDPIIKPEDQLKLAKKLGFDIVDYKVVSSIDIPMLSEYLKKRRKKSDFDIDGIIITNNEIYERKNTKYPDYAFAFKDILQDQIAKTTVLDIEWNISKDGLIKPTLILEPVIISGVEISRVTAHNAKNVVDKQLGKGAIIELIRSGDVIPKIQKVIKPAKKTLLPEGEWHWNETHVDIVIENKHDEQILIKNIYHFFSTLKTKGMGEKIVEKLINGGLNTITQILKANHDDFLKIDGFQNKSAINLEESIKKAITNIDLYKFMVASNKLGPGIGNEKIKLVINTYPNLLNDYNKWSTNEFIDKLKNINGWEDKTSSLFVNNFKHFIKFYQDNKELIIFNTIKTKTIKNKYSNLTIVFSGFRDIELENKLQQAGAKIINSISKNTDLLIVKDINDNSSKILKAKELGINIITKEKINL